jgi:pimeloyl-ACP methyl ester carboxylesterase
MNIPSNGVTLHVTDRGQGIPAIVFLHCWGGSTRTWDRIIAALPLRYRTVAIDQRGWGASEHPTRGYSVAELADDTEGAIEALGLERYILVGHSMGGKTAQLVASRRPKGLVGLVLVAPAPPSPLIIPEEVRVMLEGPNVREFVTMALGQMLTYKPLIREDAELMISDAIRGSADARAAWSRETSLEDITDAVRHIDAPTLVISGDHDKIQPIETLRRELLPRVSGAVMQVLPNVGHLSPLEAPEEIAQRLDSFAQGASVQALSLSRIEMPSLLERNLFQHPTLPREIASVRIPDSPLAQKAVDLAFRVSPAVVWTHVLRTFVFGALVGRAQNLRYDEELFFLASVLHDLGLTTEFRGTERFEVVGADAAAAFLKDQGVNDERRAIIWDAIALHTSVGIASRKRPEIALVHIGAGIDVLGLELNKLPPTLVAQTIEALPRHDFNKAFFSVLVDTIAHAPQSAAMTWMCETANEHVPGCPCPSFTSQLQASPFKE